MTISNENTVVIVGLGMLGASYAKALKKKGFYIIAIDINEDNISYALSEGFIDEGYTSPEPQALCRGDIVVFALYPRVFVSWIKENQQYLKSGAYLTDVTGIKTKVVELVQSELRDDLEFIAAHPMAGREGVGIRQSDETLFASANYVVTPSEKNTPQAVEFCKEFGRLLGFGNIIVTTPEEHDEKIAFLSQLTHCIAVALMASGGEEDLVDFTGDSFRDLTRIAKINENLWSELFVLNKTALLKEMDRFEKTFHELYDMIENEDTESMKEMMRLSTYRRGLFDKK